MLESLDSQNLFPLVSRASGIKQTNGENSKERKKKFEERLGEEKEKRRGGMLLKAEGSGCPEGESSHERKMDCDSEEREKIGKGKEDEIREKLIDIRV